MERLNFLRQAVNNYLESEQVIEEMGVKNQITLQGYLVAIGCSEREINFAVRFILPIAISRQAQ